MKHNVIVFGETGCGKSSIINMILGTDMAPMSNNLKGCTFESNCYETRIGNIAYLIHDTAGLNEGDQGRVPHWTAVEKLYTLIRKLDSVSLLVYCMRGRIKENSRANWTMFHKVICAEKVPIVAVVTGLDSESNLDGWGERALILDTFKENAMFPESVIGVVALQGKPGTNEEAYDWSKRELRNLISVFRRTEPWSSEKDEWFANIYEEVYVTRMCGLPRVQLEFISTFRKVVDDSIKGGSMTAEESKMLEASLFQAEKRFRSFKKRAKRALDGNK